ncbi:MAG: Ig-like domain-containing protein [Pseudonocardiaceae bacterium]
MATVTPDTAAGTVQFQDGTMALGSPVPVVGGSAMLLTAELAQGTHLLTAVFTPTSPAVSGPSTSPMVSMTMTGPAGGALLQGVLTKVQQLVGALLG